RAEHQHAVRGAQPDGVLRARVLRGGRAGAARRGSAPGRRVRMGRARHSGRRRAGRAGIPGRARSRRPRQHRRPRAPAPRRALTDALLRLAASAAELADDFARVRHDLAVPAGFDADVIAEAARVARDGPQPPSGATGARLDARDLALVTVDPPGTRDLDQAFHAERRGTGYRVHYAIADVAAFVAPGGALDREAFARGVTLYLPDGR